LNHSTLTNSGNLTFNTTGTVGVIANSGTLNYYGGIFQAPFTSISGNGTINNYGTLTVNGGQILINNRGILYMSTSIAANGRLNNYGTLIGADVGIRLINANSKLYNYGGYIETLEASPQTQMIDINNSTAEFVSIGGVIRDNSTSSTKPMFKKTAGTLKLYNTKLEGNNTKSPIQIPTITSGTITSTSASKLTDATKNFTTIGIAVGYFVRNTTTNTTARVTAIDNATTLSLDANIMTSGNTYTIFGNPNIQNFGTVTNCNGSTYGLLLPFDATSIAPVDLVGGDIFENTNN
jgi:hypothetical protein